jgi:predicted ester cyclase
MTDQTELERNIAFVRSHFDDFVNHRDLTAIERNLAQDFVDHDGPGGRTDAAADRLMMARMHATFPDLHVTVLDAVAQHDKVVVRNRWTGTNAQTGHKMEFHGFVMWRIAGGKIAERWGTVTPMHDVGAAAKGW